MIGMLIAPLPAWVTVSPGSNAPLPFASSKIVGASGRTMLPCCALVALLNASASVRPFVA